MRGAMADQVPPSKNLKRVRLLLWLLVALSLVGLAALLFLRSGTAEPPPVAHPAVQQVSFGGSFTLTDGEGRPFSSEALAGKPYAIFFGFTRCGDVCPTTLGRLVKLRREAANDQAIRILFVTIDPKHDGPKEVGQYAKLFDAPIIGLTGTEAQIDQVKKQYGIHAEPVEHAPAGQEMEHTSAVLLFDRSGRLAGTIAATDPDAAAVAKLKALIA